MGFGPSTKHTVYAKGFTKIALVLCFGGTFLTTVLPLVWLDECALDAAGRQYTEGDMYTFDKRAQAQYFSLLYASFCSAALVAISCSPPSTEGRSKCCRSFSLVWFTDIFCSHIYRLVVYGYVVLPVGFWLKQPNCGTKKSISGHTHMYVFHTLYACYIMLLDPQVKLLQSKQSVWSAIYVGLLSITSVFSLYALDRTYSQGYHSARHMIYGASAGVLSLIPYIFVRAKVLDSRLGLIQSSRKAT